MINCNPETVSTDYDTSDRLYFEPLTYEDVMAVYEHEASGGARDRRDRAVRRADAAESRAAAEGRGRAHHRHIAGEHRSGRRSPAFWQAAGGAFDSAAARRDRRQRGGSAWPTRIAFRYPVLVRPSYVLGGRAMVLVYDDDSLIQYMKEAVEYSQERPVLIDHFLESATEIDVDAISDGEDVVIGGIMQHIEEAGIHSGDSSCVLPAVDIPQAPAEHDPRVHLPAGARAEGRRADECAVRDSARQGFCDRGQSARLAHRALRFEGDRRAAGENCCAPDDRPQAARVPAGEHRAPAPISTPAISIS